LIWQCSLDEVNVTYKVIDKKGGGKMGSLLEVLEAKEEIRDLVARYSKHLDSPSYAEWVNLWTEDGTYDNPMLGRHPGKIELRKLIEDYWRLLGDTKPRHYLVNIHFVSIDIEGGHVKSECDWLVTHATEKGKIELYLSGRFIDTIDKVNGKWLFRERKVVPD
jgi:3-phenylpropionate/cinnamic acid dioxygenase small subunit